MSIYPILRLIFLILFYLPTLLSAEITLTDKIEKVDNFSLEYYHDEMQKFDIISIQKIAFTKRVNNKFTFGYIRGDSWFKVTLNNQSQNDTFILYLTEPYFNEVNLYEQTSTGWKKQSSGLALYLENGNRKDINPRFLLTIKAGSKKSFYIQLHTKSKETMVNFGEFIIYTQEAFVLQNAFSDFILYAFYFGTMFIIILSNLFLFITLKEYLYLYYTAYVFFNSIYVLAYSGLAYYIGLAKWHNELNISVPLLVIFFTLFSMNFLKTSLYTPRIDKILRIVISLVGILIPLIFIEYDPWFDITVQIITVFVPLLIIASTIIFLQGHTEVKYYIIALIIYMTSMMTLSLMTQGVIENSDFYHYAFIFGSFIEIIFFFFVLAHRSRETQAELIEIKEQQKQKLEDGIKQKTDKITQLLDDKRLLLKELHHRVKNNFQMVISLLWIESSKEKSKEYKESFLDLINRVQAISLIHQYLLNTETYSQIRSDEYLTKIINETIEVYSKKNLSIQTQIDSYQLDIGQSLSLGIIVNEVLSNTIKYHQNKEICEIHISFEIIESRAILIVEDNGPGFDLDEKSHGFGLKMIKRFAKKFKSHELKYNFNNGTKFMLSFKSN